MLKPYRILVAATPRPKPCLAPASRPRRRVLPCRSLHRDIRLLWTTVGSANFPTAQNASLATPASSIGSTPGFLAGRKRVVGVYKECIQDVHWPKLPFHPYPISILPTLRCAIHSTASRTHPHPPYSNFTPPRQHIAPRNKSSASGQSTRRTIGEFSIVVDIQANRRPSRPIPTSCTSPIRWPTPGQRHELLQVCSERK